MPSHHRAQGKGAVSFLCVTAGVLGCRLKRGGGGEDQAAGTRTVTIKAPNLACFKRVWTPSNCHSSTLCTIRKLEKAFIFNAYRTNESPPLRQVSGTTPVRSDSFRRIADSLAVEDLLPRPHVQQFGQARVVYQGAEPARQALRGGV